MLVILAEVTCFWLFHFRSSVIEFIKPLEYHVKEVLLTGEMIAQGAYQTAAGPEGGLEAVLGKAACEGRCRQGWALGWGGDEGHEVPRTLGPCSACPATGFRSLRFPVGEAARLPPERGGEAWGPGTSTWEFPKPPVETERSAQPCLSPSPMAFLPLQGSPYTQRLS